MHYRTLGPSLVMATSMPAQPHNPKLPEIQHLEASSCPHPTSCATPALFLSAPFLDNAPAWSHSSRPTVAAPSSAPHVKDPVRLVMFPYQAMTMSVICSWPFRLVLGHMASTPGLPPLPSPLLDPTYYLISFPPHTGSIPPFYSANLGPRSPLLWSPSFASVPFHPSAVSTLPPFSPGPNNLYFAGSKGLSL